VHAGVHAFVGAPADGTAALCELVSGRRKPRTGAVLVHGREPFRSPRTRARIGSLLARPELPDMPTVAHLLAMLARLKRIEGEPLHELGASTLVDRKLRSLATREARAVELCIALALVEPAALVIFEPFTECAPIDRAAVRERLVRRAASGAAVIIATSARSDAVELSGSIHVLEGGRLVSSGPRGWGGPDKRELCMWLEGSTAARRLAAALGERSELSAVRFQEQREGPALVAVQADDLEAAAVVVAEVVASQGVAVGALRTTLELR
jgi:ABC-2 type transport system ATP-binding protein